MDVGWIAAVALQASGVSPATPLLGICQEIEDKSSSIYYEMIFTAAGLKAGLERRHGKPWRQLSKQPGLLNPAEQKSFQQWWLRELVGGHTLSCNNATAFGVRNASIIKYAVKMEAFDFLSLVVDFKLYLNAIDASDGRTVLDYVEDEMRRFPVGSAVHNNLANYHRLLREGGAKRRAELSPSEVIFRPK